jgi:hypothetical protein
MPKKGNGDTATVRLLGEILTEMRVRFDGVDRRFDRVEQQLARVADDTRALREAHTNWAAITLDHERRIRELEKRSG